MKRAHRVALAATAVAGIAVAVTIRSASRPAFRTFTGEAMATRWEIVLPDRPAAPAAAAACFELYRQLDLELSEWKEGGPLAAVNRAAGERPLAVPDRLFTLLERSVELGRATDGAFDVTWAALWGLWDFRTESPHKPEAAEIESRLRLVDYRRLVLDAGARTVFLPERGMKLGLGAIGKGYALDRAAALLSERGFTDFLLVAGGQLLGRGSKGGTPWRVGLRDPRGGANEIFARLALGDASVSTSADNESFFEQDGVRYHHILDPATGWPTRGLRSATVLHAEATLADALSTALLVLGRERGFPVVRRFGGEALVIDEQGRLASTPGLEARLELKRPPRAD